ncbi:MAG: hypothetical protein JRJ87_20040 [Deltaproteobacteria bacterium]|nr:hypothetical protein [Deltaproteobacteria bacterium]
MKKSLFISIIILTAGLSGDVFGRQSPVLAVFNLEDDSGRLTKKMRLALTDYLSTRMGEGGLFQVVPRAEIESTALRPCNCPAIGDVTISTPIRNTSRTALNNARAIVTPTKPKPWIVGPICRVVSNGAKRTLTIKNTATTPAATAMNVKSNGVS